VSLRGQALGRWYEHYLKETENGITPDTTRKLLVQLLTHCRKFVPYYAKIMNEIGDSFDEDPVGYLQHLPILTKEIIREHFDELKSSDLERRKWYFNTSGGSTGEPVRFIQDWEYAARAGAISLLYSKLIGREIGELKVQIWGSERDVMEIREKARVRFINKLTNTIVLNSFHMTPERVGELIACLNAKQPKLIVSYVESIYELAVFCERENIEAFRQVAIMTSAGTLYPFMKEKIEKVFRCKVFNRYGSREVGDVACERPGYRGLWVAPWGSYVEIVDSRNNRLPSNIEGEILVTCLNNYSMPFIRYKIGDLGKWSDEIGPGGCTHSLLESVSGRVTQNILKKDGTIVPPEFFIHMVGVVLNTGWIRKYQVIQEDYDFIRVPIVLIRAVESPHRVFEKELVKISSIIKRVMGDDCNILYDFVGDILPDASGKYQYIISKIKTNGNNNIHRLKIA
jgi:phenylacetate-CoA ligase